MNRVNFKVVTPVYNSEKWLNKCVQSLKNQKFGNWKQIIIDDASTDSTPSIADDLARSDERIEVIHNDQNKKALANLVFAIPRIAEHPDDVIVTLDGDDWLYDDTVLGYLNNLYQDSNLWLTYGSFVKVVRKTRDCNFPISNTRTYRKQGRWSTSHLRTFRFHLWQKIKDEDLKCEGDYVLGAWDFAMMYPMVEMAGLKRIKYIKKKMYVYNDHNPLNEFKVASNTQKRMGKCVKKKPCYEEIP